LLELLLLACKESVDGCVELIATLEEIEFEDKNVAGNGAAEFLHERASRRCRATCSTELAPSHCISHVRLLTSGNDVVDNQHLLSLLDCIGLHLEEIAAILLLVLGRLTGTRKLAPLPDRHKGSAQSQRQ
jgi:hypothetical protein